MGRGRKLRFAATRHTKAFEFRLLLAKCPWGELARIKRLYGQNGGITVSSCQEFTPVLPGVKSILRKLSIRNTLLGTTSLCVTAAVLLHRQVPKICASLSCTKPRSHRKGTRSERTISRIRNAATAVLASRKGLISALFVEFATVAWPSFPSLYRGTETAFH